MSRDRLAGSVLRVVAGVLLACLVLAPVVRPAAPVPDVDAGVTVTDHRAAYAVDGRGTLRAAETLTVSFARPTAGLERRFDLRDPGAVRGDRSPRDVAVTRDGQAEEVALERVAGVVVARLGDHDRELTGEHVYVLHWTVPGVLATAGEDDDRARLRLDLLPAGWGTPVLRSRTSLELPDRPERVRCSAAGSSCRPRLADRGLVVATGRLAAGEPVRVDVVLDGEAPEAERLPWPLRLVPALGERWWPPVVVLLLALVTSYAGTRLAARSRPRRTRLAVVAAVLATAVTWVLAPWTLAVLVPGAFAVAALPLLLPGGAGRAATREQEPV
ncbi:DUF2207 domain-containing protein [Nocardioides aurantiacus]|uniref:Putative membrane protein DUF2207 n=1 Tax=Nocardioides aurantiacus TaxID=86796 RepID=A0A3N2CRD8_9ACTN|nr:DUF2207 domain-containing protein [Nocardioides aurantiacus]ROR90117.1 putative membrane protein DUF2207 [Nocardioides aurantiacus]